MEGVRKNKGKQMRLKLKKCDAFLFGGQKVKYEEGLINKSLVFFAFLCGRVNHFFLLLVLALSLPHLLNLAPPQHTNAHLTQKLEGKRDVHGIQLIPRDHIA